MSPINLLVGSGMLPARRDSKAETRSVYCSSDWEGGAPFPAACCKEVQDGQKGGVGVQQEEEQGWQVSG